MKKGFGSAEYGITGAYQFPNTDGNNGHVLQTDGNVLIRWGNKEGTTYAAGDFAQGILFPEWMNNGQQETYARQNSC